MRRIFTLVVKEIREALPATIFFMFLFHLIGISKAVLLDEYSFAALRSVGATMGALIVAKAVLVVEALPIAHLFLSRRIFNILWRTLLYSVVALLFRFVEELIPHVSKHGEMLSAIRAMIGEVSWALFAVLALWLIFGLFLYTLASDLARLVGRDKVKEAVFSRLESRSGPDGNA
jgi:hypothetical protein